MTDVDLIRENYNLICGVSILGVLLGVVVLIGLANVFFQLGRTSAISEIRNSGYIVTHIYECTNDYYIVEKKTK